MKRLMLLGWLLLAAIVAGLGFVRLAPSDPLDWNTQPELSEDKEFRGGVFRVVRTGPGRAGTIPPHRQPCAAHQRAGGRA